MTDESPQTARNRQIHEAKRPTQLVTDSSVIKEQVAGSMETKDTFKVYVKDWVHKFTAPTQEECEQRFKDKFEGRVHDADWRVIEPFPDAKNRWLELRVWNVLGEFKYREIAETFVAEHAGQWPELSIVGRSSRAEVELKDYSVKKLTGRARDIVRTASS